MKKLTEQLTPEGKPMAVKRVRVRVTGIVQGVGFRLYVDQAARTLRVGGWVRNCADGSVQILAEADEVTLQEFLDLVRRGPSGALVRECQTTWDFPTGEFQFFRVAPTETA